MYSNDIYYIAHINLYVIIFLEIGENSKYYFQFIPPKIFTKVFKLFLFFIYQILNLKLIVYC